MLVRHMFGYAPSLLATGLMSFVSLFCFTRLLSQAGYGEYSLAITAMTMLIGVSFSWLQSAASRLMPQAVQKGDEAKVYTVIYSSFLGSSIVLLVLTAVFVAFLPNDDWRIAAWFAPPLAILRAYLNINQAFHRNFIQITRYNIIEIGQAALSFAISVGLIVLLQMQASGAAIGLMTGLGAMSLFDWRMLSKNHPSHFDWKVFKEVATFGFPFIASYAFTFIISGSDRFLIENFLGAEKVGIYSAGYAFPDRIGQYLFMAVATASFPLVVRRMEQEGIEGARDQTYINGIAILALAVPACVGMILLNRQIAATLIGENFRSGAIEVMPWISAAMILNGIAAHYFDHALHLAKKTRLFFVTLGPAALFNLAVNYFYAIPHFGIMGAAYTTLAAYAIYLTLSIVIGCKVFPIKFPFLPAVQIVTSTAVMGAVLLMFNFPENILGLIAMILLGGIVYSIGILSFDILGIRTYLTAKFPQKLLPAFEANTNLTYATLTSIKAVDALGPQWQALAEKLGDGVFGSYSWFQIWWRNLGTKDANVRLHVVTAHAGNELVAVLPLVTRRSGVLRILEWAGYNVFDYGDALAQTPADAEAVWRHTMQCGRYDIALIKDVHEWAHSVSVLTAEMDLREQRTNYYLTLDFASGEAWLAAQSRKLRGDIRRKTEKMQAKGAVSFQSLKAGDDVPAHVIDALYAQKLAWFRARGATGVFEQSEVKAFLSELTQDAARLQTLYLAWLTCGETIVACHMGFVKDGILYLYHTTYDADYSAYSPGNIMMCETIKWAADNQLRELDFMRGDESYKQRFASGTRQLSAFVSPHSQVGAVSIFLHRLRRGAAQTGTETAPQVTAEEQTEN